MDIHSGRLTRILDGLGMPAGFERVPEGDLENEARFTIMRAEQLGVEPRVNLSGSSPLARWARDCRKEKRKAKIAAASRRRNRGRK